VSEIAWGEIWTLLAQIYLPGIIAAVVAFAGALVRKHVWPIVETFWRQKLGDKERAIIEKVAREAVWAAEQIAKRDDVKQAAEYKMEVARTYVDTKLRRYGIKLTATEIYGMIEASVFSELNRWKGSTGEVVTGNAVREDLCENCPDGGCEDCPLSAVAKV
jgi:hypothetical protein